MPVKIIIPQPALPKSAHPSLDHSRRLEIGSTLTADHIGKVHPEATETFRQIPGI
jgi:hypothetical protein